MATEPGRYSVRDVAGHRGGAARQVHPRTTRRAQPAAAGGRTEPSQEHGGRAQPALAPDGSALVASSQPKGLNTLDAIHINKTAADATWSGPEQAIRYPNGSQTDNTLTAPRTTGSFALTWLRGMEQVEAADCHWPAPRCKNRRRPARGPTRCHPPRRLHPRRPRSGSAAAERAICQGLVRPKASSRPRTHGLPSRLAPCGHHP